MLLKELAPETLSARDVHGRCAAHEAAATGQDSLLRLLYLLVPATLHSRDDAGWMPEDVAEAQGWESTAQLLKSLPPAPCSPDPSGDDSDEQDDLEDQPEPTPAQEDPPQQKEVPKESPAEVTSAEAQEVSTSAKVASTMVPIAVPSESPPPRESVKPIERHPLAYEILLAVLSARDLRNADGSFCLVEVPGSKGFKGFQTEVVEDSSNPVWNKSQNLVLSPEEVVMFTVMDRDVGDADDLLGKMSLPVARLLPDSFEGELQLQETGKASAFLTIRSKVLRPLYSEADVANALKASQNQTKRPPPPKPPKLHEIELTVKAAKGLRNADWSLGSSGGSDPYVTVSVPGTKTELQTPVVEDCSDPEWNFVQKLSVAPKQTLVFKVFDRDRRADELLGSAVLALSGILPHGFSGSLKLEDQGKASAAELLVSVRVLPSASQSRGEGSARQVESGSVTEKRMERCVPEAVPKGPSTTSNSGARVPAIATAPAAPPVPGEVEVTVHSASGLRNADWSFGKSGGSDAFCVVEVPGTKQQFRTNVVEDSSNPVWNVTKKLQLTTTAQPLLLSIFDRDVAGTDLLGKVMISRDKFHPNGYTGKLKLEESGTSDAYVVVSIKWRGQNG